MPNFATLIQSGRFVVAIVAPSAGKKTLIERALAEEPPSPVRYRVEALDELGHLLINSPAKLKPAISDREIPGGPAEEGEDDEA